MRHSFPLVPAAPAVALALLLALAPLAARAGELPPRDPWSGYMDPPPWAYGVVPFVPHRSSRSGTCAGAGTEWMVRGTVYVAKYMDLNPDQEKSLAALEDVAKSRAGKVQALCQEAMGSRMPATERMKRMEDALDAAKESMRAVRPPFEDFYQTLTPHQKELVDDIVVGRGPGFWWTEDY